MPHWSVVLLIASRGQRHDSRNVNGSRLGSHAVRSRGSHRGIACNKPAPFDIAVELPTGTDVAPYVEAGGTWWMTDLEPGVSLDKVRGVFRDGPAE